MDITFEPTIEGAETGSTLFFVQGWPDDETVWDTAVAELASDHRCVRVTLPNHGGARDVRWGHTFDEIVDALERCVREVSPDAPVTLVLHDWGCLYGHLLHKRSPELADRIVTIDVAPHLDRRPLAVVGSALYQWWLLAAFFIGGPVGDAMTRLLASRLGAPLPKQQITSWANYPYRNIWRDILTGRAFSYFRDYWPEVPIYYLYATKKPFQFHNQEWLDHVRGSGGRVDAVESGHWIPVEPDFPARLRSWLEETA